MNRVALRLPCLLSFIYVERLSFMKRRHIRGLLSIPFALFLLALLYAGRLNTGAKSLVANGWNGAFYSSFAANGSVPGYNYSVDKRLTSFAHLSLPGYPNVNYEPGKPPYYAGGNLTGIRVPPGLLTGNPTGGNGPNPLTGNPGTVPLTGNPNGGPTYPLTGNPGTVPLTGNPNGGPTNPLTGNPGTVPLTGNPTGAPTPPPPSLSNLDYGNLPRLCKTSTYVNVVGLPGIPPNQVTVSWSAVPGAVKYSVLILGRKVPAWGPLGKTMAAATVTDLSVSFTLNAQDVHDLLNAKGDWVILVQAQNSDGRFDGICVLSRIIRAVPRLPTPVPTVLPTWTPWPADTGRHGNGTCPPGFVGSPPNCIDHR